MASKTIKTRAPKYNEAQKTHLLDFLERHPQMVSRRLSATYTNEEDKRLWTKLTEELNDMGTKKSSKEWQEAWNGYKNKTRATARAVVREYRQTGGGEALVNHTKLTPKKERVLNLIGGWGVIEGESGVQEFGFGEPVAKKSKRELFEKSAAPNIIELTAADMTPEVQRDLSILVIEEDGYELSSERLTNESDTQESLPGPSSRASPILKSSLPRTPKSTGTSSAGGSWKARGKAQRVRQPRISAQAANPELLQIQRDILTEQKRTTDAIEKIATTFQELGAALSAFLARQ